MKAVLAAAVLSVVLVGCTSSPIATPSAAPVPTPIVSTAQPTDAVVPPNSPEEATAPPPPTAGPLGARNLPAAAKLGAGWKTYADPGGAEAGFVGNDTWTRRRDAHQAAYEALPIGCAGQPVAGSLPVPKYALAGSYRTADAQPASALLLRFSGADQAQRYYAGYQARMRACGSGGDLSVRLLWSEPAAVAAVRAYAGAESYVDLSMVHGSTVALLATLSAHPNQQFAWARSVVPAFEAVIDQP